MMNEKDLTILRDRIARMKRIEAAFAIAALQGGEPAVFLDHIGTQIATLERVLASHSATR